jgi:putative nucleotide binding protein
MEEEKEEYAWVVDFLPYGKADQKSREHLAQLIGEKHFILLEAIVKPNIELKFGQRVYVGKEQRNEIEKIKRRIRFEELTSTAKSELEQTIKKIVEFREKDFINFYNKAGPISIRLHQLEFLQGIGKKHLNQILEEREKKPFESYADIKNRINFLPDPASMIANRIAKELEGKEKNYLFVKPYQYQRRF